MLLFQNLKRLKYVGTFGLMFIGTSLLTACQNRSAIETPSYRIVSMKYVGRPAFQNTSECRNFRLSPAEAAQFFQVADRIQNTDQFQQLARPSTCHYQGVVQTHGNMLQWMITNSGVGYLTFGAGSPNNQHFLCGDACRQLFGNRMGSYPLGAK